jgi:hypothetical protein
MVSQFASGHGSEAIKGGSLMRGFAIGAITLGLMVGGATVVQAGESTLDRPDVVDVANGAEAENLKNNFVFDFMFMFAEEFEQYAYGTATASNGSDGGQFFWLLFEPDSVSRKEHKAELKQNDFLGVFWSGSLAGSPASLTTTTSVEGCSAKVKFNNNDTSCNWTVDCKKDVLQTELALDSAEQDAFRDLYNGRKIHLESKSGQGNCTAATPVL